MPQKYSRKYYKEHIYPQKLRDGKLSGKGRGRKPITDGDTKTRVHRAWLKYRYGLSTEQFDQMMIDQEGKCAICGNHFEKSPHVDHNHITGAVRALLCHHCNVMLGYAYDDVEILQNAIDYLLKYEE